MVKIDDQELTAIVGIAVFITFMVENLVNRSVVVANETDMNLLKALTTNISYRRYTRSRC